MADAGESRLHPPGRFRLALQRYVRVGRPHAAHPPSGNQYGIQWVGVHVQGRYGHSDGGTACRLLLLLLGSPASAQDFVPPDLTRFTGTWLWVESQGLVATSTPEVKGASRTLQLQSDLTYEFHQYQGTRDSLLCKGIFSVGESSE